MEKNIDKVLEVNKRLKLVRTYFNLSQAKFTERLDIDQSNYGQIELGKRKASLKLILKIHEVYKVDISWLMTGQGHMFGEVSKEYQQKEKILAIMVKYNELLDELVNNL